MPRLWPMHGWCQRIILRSCILAGLLALAGGAVAAPDQQGAPIVSRDISKLPPEVQRMRAAILQAVTSGDIEQLRVPIDMNELRPMFTKTRSTDPIGYLKSASGDGQGREMLAILYNLMTTGYAIVKPGAKEEMVVWPYHAAVPLDKLTPPQEVELYRFLPPARLKAMIAKGKYDYYSVGISKTGVWHYFTIAE